MTRTRLLFLRGAAHLRKVESRFIILEDFFALSRGHGLRWKDLLLPLDLSCLELQGVISGALFLFRSFTQLDLRHFSLVRRYNLDLWRSREGLLSPLVLCEPDFRPCYLVSAEESADALEGDIDALCLLDHDLDGR